MPRKQKLDSSLCVGGRSTRRPSERQRKESTGESVCPKHSGSGGRWLDEDTQKLLSAVAHQKDQAKRKNVNWKYIAKAVFSNTMAIERLKEKYKSLCKSNDQKNSKRPRKSWDWTADDDRKLMNAINQYGHAFRKISRSTFENKIHPRAIGAYYRRHHGCFSRILRSDIDVVDSTTSGSVSEAKEHSPDLEVRTLNDGYTGPEELVTDITAESWWSPTVNPADSSELCFNASHHHIQTLQNSIDQHHHHIQTLEFLIHRYRVVNEELIGANEDLEQTISDQVAQQTVRERNSKLKQDNTELEQENMELEQKNTELEQKNTELEQKNTELEQRAGQLTKRVHTLERRKEKLQQANEELKKETTGPQLDYLESAIKATVETYERHGRCRPSSER